MFLKLLIYLYNMNTKFNVQLFCLNRILELSVLSNNNLTTTKYTAIVFKYNLQEMSKIHRIFLYFYYISIFYTYEKKFYFLFAYMKAFNLFLQLQVFYPKLFIAINYFWCKYNATLKLSNQVKNFWGIWI